MVALSCFRAHSDDHSHHDHRLPGNKEPFVDIPEGLIADALQLLLDSRNYPILIHCTLLSVIVVSMRCQCALLLPYFVVHFV